MNYHLAFFSNFTDAQSQDLEDLYSNIIQGRAINWKVNSRFIEFCEVVLKHYPAIKESSNDELSSSPWTEEILLDKNNGYLIVTFNNNNVFTHLQNLADGFNVLTYVPELGGVVGKYSVPEDEFFTALDEALNSDSLESIEALREYVISAYSEKLTNMYLNAHNWDIKDLLIHLVQDHLSESFSIILNDSVNSPSVYSKMIGICFRKKDRSIIDKYFINHQINSELVFNDAKIYEEAKKWWKFW